MENVRLFLSYHLINVIFARSPLHKINIRILFFLSWGSLLDSSSDRYGIYRTECRCFKNEWCDGNIKKFKRGYINSLASFIAIYSTRSILLNRDSGRLNCCKGESPEVCSGCPPNRHNRSRLSWTRFAPAGPGRVLIYVRSLSIAMGKGWSGIASHQRTPCGSSTYRLRGSVRLVTLVFTLFSVTSRDEKLPALCEKRKIKGGWTLCGI